MKFSDIKVKYIYNVIFDDVRRCEFDGKHLALVLKRNNDKQTFIVMPLTSESNGVGINKVKINPINSLPTTLKNNDTYAVYNQIRTVNASRFITLKEGANVIESKIEDDLFEKLLQLGIRELVFNLNVDEKVTVLKKVYEYECINKAIELAYNIIKQSKNSDENGEDIKSIKKEIKEILYNIPYKLEQKYVEDGINDIFEDALKN